ncbi:hypothetical protein ACFSTC_60030 [Nonomuraea ferruginea]
MEVFEADWYLSSVSSTVGGAIQAVESMSPSGNGAADAESARLLKVLKEIQGQLPEDIDAITKAADKKKLSTAERLAAAVGAIPRKRPFSLRWSRAIRRWPSPMTSRQVAHR